MKMTVVFKVRPISKSLILVVKACCVLFDAIGLLTGRSHKYRKTNSAASAM